MLAWVGRPERADGDGGGQRRRRQLPNPVVAIALVADQPRLGPLDGLLQCAWIEERVHCLAQGLLDLGTHRSRTINSVASAVMRSRGSEGWSKSRLVSALWVCVWAMARA